MTKNNLQEKLVALYLRLNGYLTTGLIIHSPHQQEIEGEIDLIGVRFNFHSQMDRMIECADELEIPTDSFIDIAICEVKGGKKPTLQFNDSLRNYKDRVIKLFKWIGISEDERTIELVEEFQLAIQTKEKQKPEPFSIIRLDNITIRPILIAPDKYLPTRNQPNFIGGHKLVEFCWKCFRPDTVRESCSTDYKAVNNWGEQFERLVGYFKNIDLVAPGKIEDLYKHFNIND